jgi:hypothetical protein
VDCGWTVEELHLGAVRDESWSLFLVVLSGSFLSLEHDECQMLGVKVRRP